MWVFVLLFASNVFATSEDWSDLYEKSKNSIPIIVESGGICSGALIREDLILTAAHCASALRPIQVEFSDLQNHRIRAEVLDYDKETDLALLKIPMQGTRKILEVLPPENSIKEGEPVATIGHPVVGSPFKNPFFDRESTYLISQGILSRKGETDYTVDLSVSPGNSGGPLFNREGKIVGVISKKRVDFAVGNIGYATNHKEIQKFLQKNLYSKKPMPLWKASGQFTLLIGKDWNQVFSDNEKDLYTMRFRYAFFHRLQFEYGLQVNSTEHLDYHDYNLGYIFEFIFPNLIPLRIIPTYEREDYKIYANNERGEGFGVEIGTSIPLSLKYTRIDLDSKKYDNIILLFHLTR